MAPRFEPPMTPYALAQLIDHTLLKPDATGDGFLQLCDEAREYDFFSVCVSPMWVAESVKRLEGSPVVVATVCGFPHGNSCTPTKAAEARLLAEQGAREIDMVLPVGALIEGRADYVRDDIRAVVEACSATDAHVKVIFECALLSDEDKQLACQLSEAAGAHFVKTSTGFASGGATVPDVRLMREMVGDRLGVKAAGGIRDLATAQAMIAAGANRLGCSASIAIVKELEAQQ